MSRLETLSAPIKVIEVHVGVGAKETIDYLLADSEAPEADVMLGVAPIYCQVGNRAIADSMVTRINAHDDLLEALKAVKLLRDLFDVSDRSSEDALQILANQDSTWEKVAAALAKAGAQ